MLRLNQIYFRKLFLLFFIVVIVVSASGYYLISKIETSNYETMLKNMISQFEIIYAKSQNIDKVIKKIHRQTDIRVTIVDLDGNVIYESNRNIDGMDNHINRPEIVKSRVNVFGYSVRHSVSIDANLLYVAKKTDKFYIRMAYPLENIKKKFLRFWIYAILMFSSTMILSLWIAFKMNVKISRDLDKIRDGLDSIIAKKYDTIFDKAQCCKEFDIIVKQINVVSKKLEKRNILKTKHTKMLKELNKQQGDIISAISHEFKNPVAAIMGYAQSVREDSDLSIDIRDKFLDKVIQNAQKISYMIDRLSMAIKLESDSFVPNITSFDINLVLNDVKDMLLQKYKNRDISIEVESLKIRADIVMFENLFVNLIENALKYSEDEVTVKIEKGFLKVIDKGIGIREDDIKNLTKRFFRVDALSWDNSIGVGLYIVKYILKLHKIDLKVKSKVGVGSEFSFNINVLKI